MNEQNLLLLATKFKKLRDKVETLSVKQDEIQQGFDKNYLKEGLQGDQGPKGEQGDRGFDGAPGLDGRDGKDGADGADGKDGVSVINAEIAFDGSLVLYLSNGDQIDCGEVTPAKSKEVFQTIKNSGGSSPIDIFTAVLPGLVPASNGGTTNFLRADGTFAAPPGGAPASPTTSVQFNNAGAFGGVSTFTYASGTDTLSVGKLVSANFTSAAQGLVPASGGGTANFLRADGNFAAPPATAPAGSTDQVQFNTSGAFAASANFTYNTGTNTVSFGNITGSATSMTIQPRAPTSGSAGALTINSRNAAGSTGNGGNITMTSGQSGSLSGSGGNFTMTSGYGISGNGGDFTMSSGQGSTGGAFYIVGGGGLSAGGNVDISSGGGDSGTSGDIAIYSSAGATANGSLSLQYYGMKINWFDDGFGNITNDIGFFGATPVAQQASAPVATNLATAITLVNALRTALLNLGLIV